MLQPGNSPATRGAHGLLRTLVRHLRRAFPGAPLRIRVDDGFDGNEWLECVEYAAGAVRTRRVPVSVHDGYGASGLLAHHPTPIGHWPARARGSQARFTRTKLIHDYHHE